MNPKNQIKCSPTSSGYCVPAALAFLLDKTVDEAEILLQNEIGNIRITGVFYPMILKILKDHNYTWKEHTKHLDFAGVIMKSALSPQKFLVCFYDHVGCLEDGVYYDNAHPRGTNIRECRYRKVDQLFEIFKGSDTKP